LITLSFGGGDPSNSESAMKPPLANDGFDQ